MPLDLNKPYPKRARLLDRSSYMGTRGYFITINTKGREKFFMHPNIVSSVVEYLRDAADKKCFDVIVYCFMPDHTHLVLVGRGDHSDLLTFVTYYKQVSGYYFKKKFGTSLWATSFHDRVLRKEEDIKSVGRYVLRNPVRAGIVSDAMDYLCSGSFVYDLHTLMENDSFSRFDFSQA